MVGSRRLTHLGSSVVERVNTCLGDPHLPVMVALSGGADSAVLAWAIRQTGRLTRALHVHHGWPGSDQMESAALGVASRLGLEVRTVRVDTTGSGSPEGEARRVRYEALHRTVREGELIATGHTLTDQAETVLGNLIWGTGLDGLRGIHRRRNNLVRPLLGVSRAETRELGCLLGLPFSDDPANLDHAFRRVRIRRALASWERRLTPGIATRIADMASLVEGDIELLDQLTAEVRIEQQDGAVRIPVSLLRTLPPALAARVVRRALRILTDGYPGSGSDVGAVLRTAREGIPGWVSGANRVIRSGSYVQIGGSPAEDDEERAWDMTGPVRWGEWTWEAREMPHRPDVFPLSAWRQVFDGDLFTGVRPVIRRILPDDRLAMRRGHKRALKSLAEVGIPVEDRSIWPILELDGRVLWVPGVRRAYTGWVTSDTMSYVLISAMRETRWRPVGY